MYVPVWELSPEQRKNIKFMICYEMADGNAQVIPAGMIVQACDTGCGSKLVFDARVPEDIPKVCSDCSEWLMNCRGTA